MEEIKWTPEMEVSLFRAMQDHKPVGMTVFVSHFLYSFLLLFFFLFIYKGVNKHWHMLCIHNRMLTQGGVAVTVEAIWRHLQTLYDLNSLVRTYILCDLCGSLIKLYYVTLVFFS